MIELSVVIPSYRSRPVIARTLRALQEQQRPPDEVIVVDSSDDGTPAFISGLFPHVKVIHSADQILPGDARNIGAQAASGDVVCFVDADCTVCAEWGGVIDECYAQQPDVVASTGPVLGGSHENAVAAVDRIVSLNHIVHFEKSDGWTDNVPAANFHIRRPIFRELGGFPEGLRGNAEVVFARRLAQECGPIKVLARAGVHHGSMDTVARFLHHQRRYGHGFVAGRRLDATLYGAWILRSKGALFLAPLLRGAAICWRLARHKPRDLAVLCSHPILFARGLLSWGSGLREAAAGGMLPWLPDDGAPG